jgi:hypothetical protein
MISHEHVAYYTFLTFEKLIRENGMFINDVSSNEINGGSLRFFVGKRPGETEAVEKVRSNEISRGYDTIAAYQDFSHRVEKFKVDLTALISKLNNEQSMVLAYGASTRGNTVMQHCGFTRENIPFALDRNPMKYGMEMSGSRIPIISEDEGRGKSPDYLLILPYYFLEEFLRREIEFLESGGKFIVYLPELRFVYMEGGKIVEEKCL